jgi:hypothetical protein
MAAQRRPKKGTTVMNGYDGGDATWMMLMMPLVWLFLVGLVILTGIVVYLALQPTRPRAEGPRPTGRGRPHRRADST